MYPPPWSNNHAGERSISTPDVRQREIEKTPNNASRSTRDGIPFNVTAGFPDETAFHVLINEIRFGHKRLDIGFPTPALLNCLQMKIREPRGRGKKYVYTREKKHDFVL